MNRDPIVHADDAVTALLDERLAQIGPLFSSDVMALYGPIDVGLDDAVRKVVEHLKNKDGSHESLVVLLETNGGYIETVSRMVDTIRHHYSTVTYVIPNVAYSAGTVLAMSGDSIYMDYYSRLGPIDPQVESAEHEMLPALGYLNRYNDLMKKARTKQGLSIAEIQVLINSFDQARLYKYEQARELSVTLLIDWLCKYKFKDWKKTRTRRRTVTPLMKRRRAGQIARALSDTDRWHAHGHGISAQILRNELNLLIDDLDSANMAEAKEAVTAYHDLLMSYLGRAGMYGSAHGPGIWIPFHAHF